MKFQLITARKLLTLLLKLIKRFDTENIINFAGFTGHFFINLTNLETSSCFIKCPNIQGDL